jgi:hypothetical protein
MNEELYKQESDKSKNDFNNSMEFLSNMLGEQIDMWHEVAESLNKKYNVESTPPVINNLLFFRICFRDIVDATKQLRNSTAKSEINHNSRVLALHLYEFLEDINEMFGHKLRKNLQLLPDSDFLINELNRLKTYQKSINTILLNKLKPIRHNTIGHKHKDAIVLNQILQKVKSNDIEAYSFLVWIFSLQIACFQNNVLHMLKVTSENKRLNPPKDITTLNEEITLTRIGSKVDYEFKRCMLMLKGVDPQIAAVLCKWTAEEINREIKSLSELQDYINTKSVSNTEMKVKFLQGISPELIASILKYTPEQSKELTEIRAALERIPKDELQKYLNQ